MSNTEYFEDRFNKLIDAYDELISDIQDNDKLHEYTQIRDYAKDAFGHLYMELFLKNKKLDEIEDKEEEFYNV